MLPFTTFLCDVGRQKLNIAFDSDRQVYPSDSDFCQKSIGKIQNALFVTFDREASQRDDSRLMLARKATPEPLRRCAVDVPFP